MPGKLTILMTVLVAWLAGNQTASGQGLGPQISSDVSEEKVDDDVTRTSQLEQSLEEQRHLNQTQEKRIDKLEQALAEVSWQVGDQESSTSAAGQESIYPRLSLYGFLDLSVEKKWVNPNGFFHDYTNDEFTFLTKNINVYFFSQLSRTFSVLLEIRFSTLPHGQELTYESEALGTQYQRVNSWSENTYTSEAILLGGIGIERAHLTWQPWNGLGIIAGRYLTPFGIWNIDHGTPVLIPIQYPFMMIRHAVPLAQTGLQVFGRFYPMRETYLDYALTLSNGRGPTDSSYDLNDDKAVGLRLKLSYEGQLATVAVGGYLYYGRYEDTTKALTFLEPPRFTTSTVESYDEYLGTADLLVEVVGIRLQAELVRGLVKYIERPYLTPLTPPHGQGLPADYIKTYSYVLLGYTLPLSRLIGERPIMLYGMFEYNDQNDAYPRFLRTLIYALGVKFMPAPFVALKVQGYMATFPKMHTDSGQDYFGGVLGQVAVSF